MLSVKVASRQIIPIITDYLLQAAAADVPELSAADDGLDRDEPRVQLLRKLSHRLQDTKKIDII